MEHIHSIEVKLGEIHLTSLFQLKANEEQRDDDC
jgi:hypothetical protein